MPKRTKTKSANVWRYDGKKGTTFQAIFKHKGVREVKTFPTLAAANDWLNQMKMGVRASDGIYTPTRIKDAIERFLKETKRFNNAGNKRIAFRYFKDHFGDDMILDKITWPEMLAFRSKIMDERKITNGSMNRYWHVLHDFFGKCRRWGYVRSNPFDMAEKGAHGDKWLPEKVKKPRFLTPDEAQATLDELERLPYIRRMVAFALQTGFDRKDIMELEWGTHVKEEEKVISKQRAKIRSRSDIQSPNAGMVTISYADNPQIKRILAEAKANQPSGSARVFTRPDGKQSSPFTISQALDKAQRKVGIEDNRKRGFKCLRHTFASWQVSICKTDIFIVKDLMGHTKIETTMIYAHLLDKTRVNQAVGAIGNVMNVKTNAERNTLKVVAIRP